jgi:hypothetical protein
MNRFVFYKTCSLWSETFSGRRNVGLVRRCAAVPAAAKLFILCRVKYAYRAILTLLLAALCSTAWPGFAQERRDEAANIAETLRFRRVLGPSDQLKDWLGKNVKYIPVEPAEFERLVSRAAAQSAAAPPASEVQLTSASYQARLKDNELTAGRATLKIDRRANDVSLLTLEPCGLAVGKATWLEPTPTKDAAIGTDADGSLAVLVERSGVLGFDWSLWGYRDSSDAIHFIIELPDCPVNNLVIDAPRALQLTSNVGLTREENSVEEGSRRWRIELGGHHYVHLRASPVAAIESPAKDAWIKQSLSYDVTSRGLDIAAQLTFDAVGEPLSQVTILLDGGATLIGARLGNAAVPWTSMPTENGKETQVVLNLPEPIHESGRVLKLSAIAPLVLDTPWRLPRVRFADAHWQEGTASLSVSAPLEVKRVEPIDGRQTGVGPLSPRPGESHSFQFASRDGAVEVAVGYRNPALQLQSGTSITVNRRETSARIVCDFRASGGPQFLLEADVSPQWQIDAVESQPRGAVEYWNVESEGNRRKLSVKLLKAVAPDQPLRMVISARRQYASLGDALDAEGVTPLRFYINGSAKRLVSIRAAEPYRIRPAGIGQLPTIAYDKLDAGQRELLADEPRDLLLEDAGETRAWQFAVETRTPKPSGSAQDGAKTAQRPAGGYVSLCGLESWCEPNGALLHALTLRVQNPGGDKLRLTLPDGVSRADVSGIDLDDARMSWSEVAAEDKNTASIELPEKANRATLRLWYATPPAPLGVVVSLEPPLPQINLSVLLRTWTVWLPSGYAVMDSATRSRGDGSRELNVPQRLFGPLGRSGDRPAFDPFAPLRETNDSRQSRQWTDRADLADPRPLRLVLVHHRTLQLMGAALFLLSFAMGWWFLSSRLKWLLAIAAVLAAAAMLLPAVCLPLVSGSLTGCVLCLLCVWIRRCNRAKSSEIRTAAPEDGLIASVENGSGGSAVPCKTLTLLFIASAVLAVSSKPNQCRAQNAGAAQTARTVYSVLVPVDGNGQPSGERYLLPEDFYAQLHRESAGSAKKTRGWLLGAAAYRGTLSREPATGRLSIDELRASFDLRVLDQSARVRLYLPREGTNLLPDGILLDDRAVQAEWEPGGEALAFDVSAPGAYRLELVFGPNVHVEGNLTGFDMPIPPIANSRLELSLPGNAPAIDVQTAYGSFHREDDPRRLIAELGPTDRLIVCWPTGKTQPSGPTFDVEQLFWLKIAPGQATLDVKLKLRPMEGQPQQVVLQADPRLRLLPFQGDDAPAVDVYAAPGQLQTIVLQWDKLIADRAVVDARFLLTETSGVGNLRPPTLEVLDAKATRKWMAVSLDPMLASDERDIAASDLLPVADFLNAWGKALSQPRFALRMPAADKFWSISTFTREPQTAIDQTLSLGVAEDGATVALSAQLLTSVGYHFQIEIKGPAQLAVQRISLLEDGAERVKRWSQDKNGLIAVFLSGPVTGKQTLSLRGRLPGRPTAIPWIQFQRGKVASSNIYIYRQPSVRVDVAANPNLVEINAPPSERGKSDLGYLSQAFRVATDKPVEAPVSVTPNRPAVRVEQTLLLSHNGQSWQGEAVFRVRATNGILDELRVNLPAAFAGLNRIIAPATLKVVDASGDTRQVVLQPPAPFSGYYEFRLSGPVAVAPGEALPLSQFAPVGASNVEQIVALPNAVQGRPIAWDTSGLRRGRLPNGIAGPADAGSIAVYETTRQGGRIVLLDGEHPADQTRVQLADIHIAWQTDGSYRGYAAFDVDAGKPADYLLQFPQGCKVLEVAAAGSTAADLSSAGDAWRVSLPSDKLPRRIEAIYTGALAEPSKGGLCRFDAPKLADLPVERTLWTVEGPPAFEAGVPLEEDEVQIDDSTADRSTASDAVSALSHGLSEPIHAGNLREIWNARRDNSSNIIRLAAMKNTPSISLEYHRRESNDLASRLCWAIVLGLAVPMVALGLRRPRLGRWLDRRPYVVAGLIGLAWWLWLWPSALGFLIVFISLIAAARSWALAAREKSQGFGSK